MNGFELSMNDFKKLSERNVRDWEEQQDLDGLAEDPEMEHRSLRPEGPAAEAPLS